jgi:hypothetical protein
MTTLQTEFEALMPEPTGFRSRYRSEPEMIGHYPWTYADAGRRRRRYDRPECEYQDLYTADQMRAMFDAATERAAKLVESGPPPRKIEGGRVEIGEVARNAFAASIRARVGVQG